MNDYLSQTTTISINGYGTFVVPTAKMNEVLLLLQQLQSIKTTTQTTESLQAPPKEWSGRQVLNG